MNKTPGAPMELLQNSHSPTAQEADDPLLMGMAMMAKLLGHPVHVQVLRLGFVLDEKGHIPLAAYPDMAHQHGLMAAWSRMPLVSTPVEFSPLWPE